jgi:hypothetical protein
MLGPGGEMQASKAPGPSARGADDATAGEERNGNTVFLPSSRDVAGELAASLEREAGAIGDHFGAELPADSDLAARVALVSSDGVSLHELPASPDEYLVVGRHSEATVRSADAASLSLRHVLLIPQRVGAEPDVVLDIVALAPTIKIAPWPRTLPRPLADRCAGLALGDSLLLVAPVAHGDRPADVFIAPEPASKLAANLRVTAPMLDTHASANANGYPSSRLTRISSAAPALRLPPGEDLADDARLVLEVRDDSVRVRIGLREPWLIGGIVIGRNQEKCSHASLARVLTPLEVSRCHLYLRREQDEIVFYDTASTCGVYLSDYDEDAEPIRRFVVPAPRAALERGGYVVNPTRTWLWLTPEVRVTLYTAGDHDREP